MFGRDPTDADPIFTEEVGCSQPISLCRANWHVKGIKTLTRHAFDSPSFTTSRNALRCIANAMLLRPETRQIFVDLGCLEMACKRLKNDTRDDEFLLSRIILLTTYETNIEVEKLIDEHHLAEYICLNISRHANKQPGESKDPLEGMALIESLKLVFNIAHFCPQRAEAFSPALPHILTILAKTPLSSSEPLEAPVSTLINSMVNIPLGEEGNVGVLFPKTTPNLHVDVLIDILDKSTKAYTDDKLELFVSPVTALIHKVYEVAPADVQKHIQSLLLPSLEDRKQPLGRGESLSARLLRISADITTPKIQESAGSLLYEISDKDAIKFVDNIGYGYASGFLARHKIAAPPNAMGGNDAGSSATGVDLRSVNPITGQTLESEPVVDLPEMTDAEKEREAERLFVLFERYVFYDVFPGYVLRAMLIYNVG